ncbi:MAG: hypothetical protein ACPF9R_03680 [Acholeplasmataceae bacterium]
MFNLCKKLQLQDHMNVFYDDALHITQHRYETYDTMLLYVTSIEMLETKLKNHLTHLRKDGLLWILFPKESNTQHVIEQDLIMKHLNSLEYQKMRSISLNQEVSALKFKHRTHIKRLSIKGSMRVSDMMGGHYGK